MRLLLSTLLLVLGLAACETTDSMTEHSGARVHLSEKQLYTITSQHPLPTDFGRQLPLTPAQTQKVKAQLGKDVTEVWVLSDTPNGRASQYGYNLAVRDQAESIVVLSAYAMSPDEVARRKTSTPPLPQAPPEPAEPSSAPAEEGTPQVLQRK